MVPPRVPATEQKISGLVCLRARASSYHLFGARGIITWPYDRTEANPKSAMEPRSSPVMGSIYLSDPLPLPCSNGEKKGGKGGQKRGKIT